MATPLSSSPGISFRNLGIVSSQDKGLILVLLFIKVVAVAVFLALAFAFYVFFAPFVGKKIFQYVVIGLYTPLVSISL